MLTISRLSKTYGTLQVLRDVNLEVKKGEIVSIIGPSGCGKSSLMNIISGLVNPDEGIVDYGNARISYLFQSSRLLPWRTVYDNIRIVRDDSSKEEILSLIGSVGLNGFENYYPSQISGGMARRCALARAVHYGGDIMLMDEPFQGLDYGLRMEMLSLLLEIWNKGQQTILFATHEIDEALTISHRIVLLSCRPAQIQEIIHLSGRVGREAAAPQLGEIRRKIINHVTEGKGSKGTPLREQSLSKLQTTKNIKEFL